MTLQPGKHVQHSGIDRGIRTATLMEKANDTKALTAGLLHPPARCREPFFGKVDSFT
jgi:hypothetical protein